VQRDIKEVPYKIVQHSNGDAWVEAQGQKCKCRYSKRWAASL
jgi:hypothetical protein